MHTEGIEWEARPHQRGANRLLDTLRITRNPQHRQVKATVGPESKKQRNIVRAALSVIKRHGGVIPEDEMLRETYMELLQRKIDFESMREIEQTLLQHNKKKKKNTNQKKENIINKKCGPTKKKEKHTSTRKTS